MTLVEIPYVEPIDALGRMASSRLAFLDSAMPHDSLGRWSFLAVDPVGVFEVADGRATFNGEALPGAPMAELRRLLSRPGFTRVKGGPPFQGGAVGHLAYEAAHLFERLPVAGGDQAMGRQAEFAIYDSVIAFDVIDRRTLLCAPDEVAIARLRERLAGDAPRRAAPPALTWQDSRGRATYEAEVARVIAYIRDGDIFQANLSHRFTAALAAPPDAIATYRALRKANPAPFGALIADGERFLASTSPERFLRLAGREVETRPIKGTARRAAGRAEDEAAALALAASEKDRAENVMIVDLLRNDLSRVCEPASVAVPVLCGVETYASVHHLTSVVTGRLALGRDVFDLVAATFPGGSITGAPKIRAMEIITELEKAPRGAYCGSIGWIGFDGDCDLNIAIRTLECDGRSLAIGAGGGITLLSDPAAEYEETLAKAERLLGALGAGASLSGEAA